MKVFCTIEEIREARRIFLEGNRAVGFVPTMGALHEGHLALVRRSKEECNVTMVSIYVNPSQFNNVEDLKKYPRNVERDLDMLDSILGSEDIVFTPYDNEMYPEPDNRTFDFGELDKRLEGAFRPGHFNGVAQIVSKLFDITMPTKAYFGLKDFQQLLVVKELVKQMKFPVEIVPCEIVREADGLAMSSRNARLDSESRKNASVISRILLNIRQNQAAFSTAELKEQAIDELSSVKGAEIEYFEIAESSDLKPCPDHKKADSPIALVAVWIGNVRLIDNMFLRN